MELYSTTPYDDYLTPSSTGGKPFTIYHFDVASFYPSIIGVHKVAPSHIDTNAFCNLISWMKQKRVDVKHSEEEYIDGIAKDILALVLKIVINSIYGKLGFEKGDLYDRLAVLKVTVNGQLMLLMLCEALELDNIHIISANTDGIMVKVYIDQEDKFKEITTWWQDITGMQADSDVVHSLIARDVNNYITQFRSKGKLKIESKGALNPMMYSLDLTKGYSMPIVAQAIENYFLKNKPVMDTLQEATNILDFCLTQNVGKQFHVEETKIENGQVTHVICQRYVRFYVSNRGYIIEKVHNDNGSRSRMAAGSVVTVINSLDDKDISLRDINFKFYYSRSYEDY
jgi:DNA polymerase family B